MRNRWWAVPGLAAAALLLAGCGLIGGSSASSGNNNAPSHPAAAATSPAAAKPIGAGAIKELSTSKGIVLTNASGMTLYWFAKDTTTKSLCLIPCKTYWPPVIMSAAAAAGTKLPHGFGTITRPSGAVQLTYDGHPLYTYAGDTVMGMVTGNGLNAQGGLWWAMTPTGVELGAASSSAGGTSGSSAGTSTGTTGGGGASWG